MIVVGTCNVDDVLIKELSKSCDVVVMNDHTDIDTLIIDWMPTNHKDKKYAKLIILQSLLVNKFAGEKPIVIFDRYLAITHKERNWLKKKNVTLCEPAINYRRDFKYLPAWIKTNHSISIEPPQKEYDIVYNGGPSDNIIDFERYLLKYCKETTSNKNVCYKRSIGGVKTDEYTDSGLVLNKSFSYEQSKFSILIGTPKHYRIGVLHPDLPAMLKADCIPLIPCEHRYFNAMFGVINHAFDIALHTQTYDQLYYGYMTDVYENIEKYYPEMLVENVAKILMNYLKEK